MKRFAAGVVLGMLSLSACAQEEQVYQFNDFDEAAEFIYEAVHGEVCGTAVSAMRDAMKEHGIPEDIKFAPGGWQMEWYQQTGILYMSMYDQSRDPTYEICLSYFLFRPFSR